MSNSDLSNLFPAKTRSTECIRRKKQELNDTANGKVKQNLDFDVIFKDREADFLVAVENNRTGRVLHGKKTVVWEGVAVDLDIPHVDAATCKR